MTETVVLRQEEKVLAGLAHGSILLGLFTNGIGGIVAALVIWLVEKEKSAYAAAQALQALVYQAVIFILTMLAWCCWGFVWLVLILVPIASNPALYEDVPPNSLWIGLALMIIPLGLWFLTILYGLIAAARCLGGHDFQYAVVGRWLKSQP